MPALHIDIVSDIACPWCAIGYARLQQAIMQLNGEMQITVSWRAFELNPDPDAPPLPITEALSRKYGRPAEAIIAAQNDMMRIASELGLNFTRMQERMTRNTFDGHRLVKWAAQFDRQSDMKMALFDAYFGAAADITDAQVLADCATAAGLNATEASAILASDQFAEAVRAEEASYQQAGINSVPAFIINQQYLISGAQEADTLVSALRQIAAQPITEPNPDR
ncbi:MAG: DsbA family oxidoreductase [Gammaproteobacteria bacterium HGW-Gammaproteobacteria-6]|nr:MAG: DsbA family oxidoreductase [Gammaproteobacteria bacterium HGW-Gammaproteobacteria-6]